MTGEGAPQDDRGGALLGMVEARALLGMVEGKNFFMAEGRIRKMIENEFFGIAWDRSSQNGGGKKAYWNNMGVEAQNRLAR